jgi:hypothetical protein
MVYTKTELEALWLAVNPGNGNPHTMAAIALAESSGEETIVNSVGACGLWQIHPYESGCIGARANARMAGEKLRSQGLGAWETYTNGSYKAHLTGGSENLGSTEDASFLEKLGLHLAGPFGEALENEKTGEQLLEGKEKTIPGLSGSLSSDLGLGGLTKIIELLSTKDGWIRIGKVLVGLLLLLVGLFGMANLTPPPVGKPAVGVTRKVGTKAALAAGIL